MQLRLERITNGYLVHCEGVGDRGTSNRHCDEQVISRTDYCADADAVAEMFRFMAEQHFLLQETNQMLIKEHFAEQRASLGRSQDA